MSISWPRAVSMMIGNDGRLGFQLLANIETAHPRHHHVQHDEIGIIGEGALEARTPSSALITSYPSYSKLSRSPATIAGSSSTIKMRVLLLAGCRLPPRSEKRIARRRRLFVDSRVRSCSCPLSFSCVRHVAGLLRARQSGNDRVNLLPCPGVLSTSTSPPCACVMWRTSDRPRPLPFVLCTSGSPGPIELLEDLRLLASRDADAVIRHLELHDAVCPGTTSPPETSRQPSISARC